MHTSTRAQTEAPAPEGPQTKWQQRIGQAVSTPPGPGRQPGKVTLKGTRVTVEPLVAAHAGELYAVVQGEDNGHLWTYLSDEAYPSLDAFGAAVTAKSQSADPLFFAVTDNGTQQAVGWASLMRIDSKSRVVEVGHILFSPSLQHTTGATEAMYLLAKYVFEDLGYRRYEWKCDTLNLPSKRAALRLGFTYEGLFRQHLIYKGRSRDTAWFSMIDSDWLVVKRGFEAWLDDKNFDAAGKQRHRLEELRDRLPDQRGPVALEL